MNTQDHAQSRRADNGFSFVSMDGHLEGTGNSITFSIDDHDGKSHLRVTAFGNGGNNEDGPGWLANEKIGFPREVLWKSLARGINVKYSCLGATSWDNCGHLFEMLNQEIPYVDLGRRD